MCGGCDGIMQLRLKLVRTSRGRPSSIVVVVAALLTASPTARLTRSFRPDPAASTRIFPNAPRAR